MPRKTQRSMQDTLDEFGQLFRTIRMELIQREPIHEDGRPETTEIDDKESAIKKNIDTVEAVVGKIVEDIVTTANQREALRVHDLKVEMERVESEKLLQARLIEEGKNLQVRVVRMEEIEERVKETVEENEGDEDGWETEEEEEIIGDYLEVGIEDALAPDNQMEADEDDREAEGEEETVGDCAARDKDVDAATVEIKKEPKEMEDDEGDNNGGVAAADQLDRQRLRREVFKVRGWQWSGAKKEDAKLKRGKDGKPIGLKKKAAKKSKEDALKMQEPVEEEEAPAHEEEDEEEDDAMFRIDDREESEEEGMEEDADDDSEEESYEEDFMEEDIVFRSFNSREGMQNDREPLHKKTRKRRLDGLSATEQDMVFLFVDKLGFQRQGKEKWSPTYFHALPKRVMARVSKEGDIEGVTLRDLRVLQDYVQAHPEQRKKWRPIFKAMKV